MANRNQYMESEEYKEKLESNRNQYMESEEYKEELESNRNQYMESEEYKEKLESNINQYMEKLESNRNQYIESKKLESEARQEHRFFETKNYYEEFTFFVKLTFNKLFSILKERGEIKECDAEEFLKSENTEEFQNQKMRHQNTLKEALFEDSDNDPFDFALKSFGMYGWKVLGLFNK